jgi:hypothetical protein
LKFFGVGTATIGTLAQSLGYRYRPTYAFDIDPVIGGSVPGGYNQMATLYNTYRVNKSRITLKISNQSTQGASICVFPTLADPGASPSFATVAEWFSNPYCKTKTIGTNGSPAVILTSEMSTEKLLGSKTVLFDDGWAAAVNNGPARNWFWAVGYLTGAAPATAMVFYVETNVEIDVEFYERKVLPQ